MKAESKTAKEKEDIQKFSQENVQRTTYTIGSKIPEDGNI
jgi:hypothetical protein